MAGQKPDRNNNNNRRRNDRGRPKGSQSPEGPVRRASGEPEPPRDPSERLKIGITIGDIHGIGPELLLHTFSDVRLLDLMVPVVYGSARALNHYKQHFKADKFGFALLNDLSQPHGRKVNLIEVDDSGERIEPGTPSAAAGRLAFKALERATADLREGHIDALTTLPIDKATMQSDAFRFPGHTEYLASQFGRPSALMLMVYDNLRVAVVTGHIPISDVAKALTVEGVRSRAQLLHDTLRIDFNIAKPRIAILGLNPHAGDGGLIGKEDREIIKPAIEALRNKDLLVYGPYPADGFFASDQRHRFDAVLAMYHDQGLIPFKALSSGWGVNYTAGLPAIRTSPDHGTAYDIAGKGRADMTSFRNALYCAIDVFRTRRMNQELILGALGAADVIGLLEVEEE